MGTSKHRPPRKIRPGQGKKRAAAILIVGSLLALASTLAGGPDRELRFERRVPWNGSMEQMNQAMNDPERWTQWFYGLDHVERAGKGLLKPGQKLELAIDPKKGAWKKFSVSVKVTAVGTARRPHLALEVLGDSKGKLQKVFSGIRWEVTADEHAVTGRAWATTRSWRSRLLSRLSERIVMNQVFYPDVMRLVRNQQGQQQPQGISLSPSGM